MNSTQLLPKENLLQDSMLTGHRGYIESIATDSRYIVKVVEVMGQ
ncbi:MAG: hypothetical protein QM493_08865 [Sulfurovum sp.]